MKRSGDIASLFQKYASKKKASTSIGDVPEEKIQEQEDAPEKEQMVEENVNTMPSCPPPGDRQPIASYPVNDQDTIRKAYIIRGPFKPYAHDFESRRIGNMDRQFSPIWFYNYPWIEYSIKLELAFCFVCYLFAREKIKKSAFLNGGWNNWNRYDALDLHMGGVKSAHNATQERYNLFVNPQKAIDEQIVKVDNEDRRLYKIKLTYSIRCLKFLLQQGL
jgi:hypothetical protein